MLDKLKNIRERYRKTVSLPGKILHSVFIILLGAVMGFFAEYLEYYYLRAEPDSFLRNGFAAGLSNIGNMFAVWILTATLIAYSSRGPVIAGLHTFCFFGSMDIVYFYNKTSHYGYSIHGQLIFWSIISIVSAGAAILIWYSRTGGWPGAMIKASPIAAILAEAIFLIAWWIEQAGSVYGSKLRYIFQTEHVVEFIFYIFAVSTLLLALPKGARERSRVGLLTLLMCPIVYFVFSLIYKL